jgi:thymidylate synthase ThyX
MSSIKVEYINHCGDDLSVVDAARCSFDKKSDWDYYTESGVSTGEIKGLKSSDEKLIKYLATHKHFSPFNHSFISLRVTAPVLVARQLVKHKFLPWNEVSRRYVSTPPEFYKVDAWRKVAENVKQGSSTEKLPTPEYENGFCAFCGDSVLSNKGGRTKKYCSDKCKHSSTNSLRNPYKTVFQNAKARVKREETWEWELDFDTMEFPEYCTYLGIKLNYDFGKGQIEPNSPSFDRIDSMKGYTKDNVEIVSHKANTMKSNASKEEQVKMAEEVLLRYKGYVPDYNKSPEGLEAKALELYNQMIADGYCAEQARQVLPQSMMTTWIWSGTLGAFCDMLVLRLDEHTQYETRVVAQQVAQIVKDLFPVSYKALVEK